MLKSIVKTGVVSALGWTGADRAIAWWTGTRAMPLVLGYHAVVEDIRAHVGRAMLQNLISVEMLERQLEWIGRRYRFLTLDELGAQLERNEPFSKPSAVITFDDGYAGVYHHAWPLLKRKGIPAGAFIVTEATGRGELQLFDKVYLLLQKVLPILGRSEERFRRILAAKDVHLDGAGERFDDPFSTMRWLFTGLTQNGLLRAIEALETVDRIDDADYPELQPMNWEMVQVMADSGITIGSHTQTHALLTMESGERVVNQTVGSMSTLRAKLNSPVAHFAYPDGRYNAGVLSAVAEAGYRFAYGTCLRRDSRFPFLTIPRTQMWERSSTDATGRFSPSLMSCHANRLYDLWSPCAHNHAS